MSASITLTYSGDGVTTCRCCGNKIIKKGGIYEGVCSLKCSSSMLEYNAIPINLLFVKRIYLHINDEEIRNKEIDNYIAKNNLNKEVAKHKIEKVGKYVIKNKIEKLNISSNTVYYVNN